MSIDVNGSPQHIAALMGGVLTRVREAFVAAERHGLRPSHYRLLEHVPADGVRITDLAQALGMTKQGCGQHVAALVDVGSLEAVPDPSDRRARVVVLTDAGRRAVAESHELFARIEHEFAVRLGPARYAELRGLLAELGA